MHIIHIMQAYISHVTAVIYIMDVESKLNPVSI